MNISSKNKLHIYLFIDFLILSFDVFGELFFLYIFREIHLHPHFSLIASLH